MNFKKPPPVKAINSEEVYKLMEKKGWVNRGRPPMWFVLDSEFILPTEEEVQDIIKADRTEKQVYVPNSGDCDNYAFELRHAFGRRGWAVGMIAIDTGKPPLHAIFFYINDERELVAIEPQNDKRFEQDFTLIAVEMH